MVKYRKRKPRRLVNPREPLRWQWVAKSYLEGYRVLWDSEEWDYEVGGNPTFPLFAMLRHAIELYLKWGLATADRMRGEKDGLRDGHNLCELADALEERASGVIGAPLRALIQRIHALDPGGDAVRYPTDRGFNQWAKGVDVMSGGHQETVEIVDDGRDLVESIRTLPSRVEEALRASPISGLIRV